MWHPLGSRSSTHGWWCWWCIGDWKRKKFRPILTFAVLQLSSYIAARPSFPWGLTGSDYTDVMWCVVGIADRQSRGTIRRSVWVFFYVTAPVAILISSVPNYRHLSADVFPPLRWHISLPQQYLLRVCTHWVWGYNSILVSFWSTALRNLEASLKRVSKRAAKYEGRMKDLEVCCSMSSANRSSSPSHPVSSISSIGRLSQGQRWPAAGSAYSTG